MRFGGVDDQMCPVCAIHVHARVHVSEKIITVLKIVQSALFLGLHTNLPQCCYVDKDPLWSDNSKNNAGSARHT